MFNYKLILINFFVVQVGSVVTFALSTHIYQGGYTNDSSLLPADETGDKSFNQTGKKNAETEMKFVEEFTLNRDADDEAKAR